MNSQKLSGTISCLAAILILAADKIFAPVCKGTMELANGGECMMRCHYYGIALFYINHRCHRRIRIHATTFQTECLITFPVIYNQESKLSLYAKKPESDR